MNLEISIDEIGVRMKENEFREVETLKKTLKWIFLDFLIYFPKGKSDYCVWMMSALRISELK